jgi:hypothetical protein
MSRQLHPASLQTADPPAWHARRQHRCSCAGRGRGDREENVTGIELQLDFAVFEDGLSVGPDLSNQVENMTADLAQKRSRGL